MLKVIILSFIAVAFTHCATNTDVRRPLSDQDKFAIPPAEATEAPAAAVVPSPEEATSNETN